MQPNDYQREVTELRAKLAAAEEELRQWRAAFAPKVLLPRSWGLTLGQRAMLLALYAAPLNFLPARALHMAATGKITEGDYENTVACQFSKMRSVNPMLRGFTETLRGEGYRLTPAGRAAIAGFLPVRAAA